MGIAYRRGLPLEDMEFFQCRPAGIYKLGSLLSETMRGEGGFLVNGTGERFMERYAPTMKDLASRDVVCRSIYQEIAAGRGVNGEDFVRLDVRHLGVEILSPTPPPGGHREAAPRAGTELHEILHAGDGERPAVVRAELRELMFRDCGVYRT